MLRGEKTHLEKVELKLKEVFYNMVARCYKDYCKDYKNYGARGIKICDEWLNNIDSFIEWSLNNGYNMYSNLSIDRIDNDGDYTPENCHWVPQSINCRKTRRSKLSYQDAEKIRELFNNGTYSRKELQASKGHLSAVLRRDVWKKILNG